MSDGDKPIPMDQLIPKRKGIASIRDIKPQQARVQFKPNINASVPMEEEKKEETKETHRELRVKKERIVTKKAPPPPKKEFKPRPATHGQGGFGIKNTPTLTSTYIPKDKTKEMQLETNPELDLDPCNPNHPITLPLKDPRGEKEEDNESITKKEEKKTYYTPLEMLEEDPKNINNAMRSESGLITDEYILLQIPSVLPKLKTKQMEEEKKEEKKEEEGDKKDEHKKEQNPLKGMTGMISTIQFRKSGAATMKIGGVTFVLTKGSKPHFLEETSIVSMNSNTVYRLGNISQHVVMTPKIDECLNSL